MSPTSELHKYLVFGGGGKVALQFATVAAKAGHEVTSVIRNDAHVEKVKSTGATPYILSLEEATTSDITALMDITSPHVIIFAAGAGGKGGTARTRAVDFEGAIKVFDAMEATHTHRASNTHRIVLVSACDLRDRKKPAPSYYNEESKKKSEQMWKDTPDYMEAKLAADQDLHARPTLKYTIIRPGELTDLGSSGCQLGQVQLGKVSRETVAKVLLRVSMDHGSYGKTWDVMDGDDDVDSAVKKAIETKADSWHE
jgi:nucleoside-diphosphate-sugar epimerase